MGRALPSKLPFGWLVGWHLFFSVRFIDGAVSTNLIKSRLRSRRLFRNHRKRQLPRNHGPSERQSYGYHRLNIQSGVFFRVHSELPVGRLVGTPTRHVVCNDLGYCESVRIKALPKLYWLTIADRCYTAMLGVFRSTHDGWPFRMRNRHRD